MELKHTKDCGCIICVPPVYKDEIIEPTGIYLTMWERKGYNISFTQHRVIGVVKMGTLWSIVTELTVWSDREQLWETYQQVWTPRVWNQRQAWANDSQDWSYTTDYRPELVDWRHRESPEGDVDAPKKVW